MANEVEVVSQLDLAGRPANVINMTEITTGAIAESSSFRELARSMGQWVTDARSGRRGAGEANMFRRDRYVSPDNPYDQMRTARDATDSDDIVSGIAEVTESIAFSGLKWEGEDADGADVFNQLSADLNLDALVRAMWRDEFRYEQAIVAMVWGKATYNVRGKTAKGNKRKKVYDVWVPRRLVNLDPMKCVPIGVGPLREDRLAWFAGKGEIDAFDDTLVNSTGNVDPLMTTFFTGQYQPGEGETETLANMGIDTDRLLAMNPEAVFRHTSTKADYELFPTLRMKSVFGLLDLKQQLLQSDRASLIGAANYILLIRKGNDNKPGTNEEIQNLQERYNFLAKLPVIISDHRLEIDIIAPKLDFVLKESAYDVIDKRILSRMLGALAVSSSANQNTSGTNMIGALMAKVMENRRHMLKRTLERNLAKAVVDHPRNAGLFDGTPSLVYTPRNVSIDTDQAYTTALLALRTQREVSRETVLEYLGLDQATEAQRVELEEEQYDDVFKTQIPFAAPGVGNPNAGTPADAPDTPNGTPEAPAVSGRRGGRPAGGGTTPQSPQAQTKPKTSGGGNPSTKQ